MFKVRVFAASGDWVYDRADGSIVVNTWYVFGPLETERLFETK
ncbi:MAG TPA: hypothetical protein VF006_09525 [Longimicrobium sp.]